MTACFPTAYFGNLHYFARLIQFNEAVIEQHEHFVKQTGRTRCELLGPQGVLRLSVPVTRPQGNKTPMFDVMTAADGWQRQHLKAIHSAYGSSPFFEHYQSDIQQLLYSSSNLISMNTQITEFLFEEWGFDTKLNLSDSYESDYSFDFRNHSFDTNLATVPYNQVLFDLSQTFFPNLSALDLLFCEGPLGRNVLLDLSNQLKPFTHRFLHLNQKKS